MPLKTPKYCPDSIRSNRVSTFYLYEIDAIPKKIREKYKDKLLRRKNAVNQKNVKLLLHIYSLIKQGSFHSWSNNDACQKAGFEKINQLYWYKAKILKDLREMYFRWDKLEKEVKKENIGKNSLDVSLAKADKMFDIGMIREAKRIYLASYPLFEALLKKNKLSNKQFLQLSRIYRRLMTVYSNFGNLEKFNIYFKKFQTLIENKNRFLFDPGDRALLRVYQLQSLNQYHSFFIHDSAHLRDSLECEEEIIRICTGHRFDHRYNDIKVATLYGAYSLLEINFPPRKTFRQKALEYLKLGHSLAKKHGYSNEEKVFRLELLAKDITPENLEQNLKIIGSIYKNLKKSSPANIWTVRALSSYINCLVQFKPDKFDKMLARLTKVRILRHQMANAMYNIYVNKTMPDRDAVQNLGSRQKYVILDNVKISHLDKHEEMTNKMIRELRNIHHTNGRVYILINQLHAEFLKGCDFDFEKTGKLIRKIEWFKKTKEVRNDILGNYYELLKLGLRMFDESLKYDAKADVLDKFQMKFSLLCDDIIQKNNQSLSLTKVYLMITFIARQLNYPEIWDIAQKQWDYLHQNHPTITKSLKSHLKKQNRLKAA